MEGITATAFADIYRALIAVAASEETPHLVGFFFFSTVTHRGRQT